MKTTMELDAQLEHIRAAPRERGVVEMIVRRPATGERELLDEAELDAERGLVGDRWMTSRSRHTSDGSPHPDQQVTLMSMRALEAIADRSGWPLAGDQLIVELDLSQANLPPGTQLELGSALLEITALPHLGCAKFTERYGSDATKWVNGEVGRSLRLRGVNARVVRNGTVKRGDVIVVTSLR